MKTINRRSFCAGAAILGGSFALAGCSGIASKQADEEKPKGEIIETDIAVIGSGLAGEACALAAAQNGAKVADFGHFVPDFEGQCFDLSGCRKRGVLAVRFRDD